MNRVQQTCEPCSYGEQRNVAASKFCQQCEESYCDKCSFTHKSQKATRNHDLVDIGDIQLQFTKSADCEPCFVNGNTAQALFRCFECNECYCDVCARTHKSQKATRNHEVVPFIDIGNTCEVCSYNGDDNKPAAGRCTVCDEVLCAYCIKVHSSQKATRQHEIKETKITTFQKSLQEVTTNKNDREREHINKMKPGKPGQVGALKADRITVTWSAPDVCLDQYMYQIRYKRKGITQWEYYDEKTTHNTATVKGLKSYSTYVFEVRMVNNETEGPYSEVSDEIETLLSAAELLIPMTVKDLDYEGCLSMHKITLTENVASRNPSLKTRKLAIGNGMQHTGKEKTILLLGASGTGKTTFVNGIVNYIFGVSFVDPFRFTLVDLENDERANTKDKEKTRWITCYTIYPSNGSSIDYPITVVDTPGFCDKGFEENETIKKQLRELFSPVNEKGILFVDAVCIFMKASEVRLSVTQQYILTTITSFFHRDIKENICFVFTFSDGNIPPILSSLRKLDLLSEPYFTFNTTDIFSDNTQSLTKIYYERNFKSFETFLTKVKSLKSKRLSQSNDVFAKREELQKTAEALLVRIDLGFEKMENCKRETAVLENLRIEMIANENFEFKRKKKVQLLVPLEKGKHTINCLHCNITCHPSCVYSHEDMYRCPVMDKNGYCTVCEDKCHWKEHRPTPFTIEWNEVEETCVNEELKAKYEKTKGELESHEAVVSQIKKELDDIETEILDTMNKIAACKKELCSMALRANPLGVSEYIDIIIENEIWTRNPGFMNRINNLKRLKRRTAVEEEFEQFIKGKEEINS